MLEARAVTLAHGREIALREASLEVAPGELVALCGPNGAGKSTLLAALAGEMRPRAGEVTLDGAPVAAMCARALALRRAVLEQNPVIAAPFTVASRRWRGSASASRSRPKAPRRSLSAPSPSSASRSLATGR